MKKPRNEKQEVDLLKPVTLSDVPEEDCFGKEYNPQDRDCSICADIEICGIKFQSLVQKKKKAFEEKHGPLMDETDFKSVNMEKLEKLAKKYEDEGEPMTHEELVQAVSGLANTKDEVAVIEFLKRTLPLSNLILKEGNVYARRKDNTN